MESLNYTIDCWAFFGPVHWDIETVYQYIESAHRIYSLFGSKASNYGFCEIPHGTVKGVHIGSTRNVLKKVDTVYSKGATLKSLEFFSLPKGWNFAYSDYGIYLSRNKDFIVLGYDTTRFPSIPLEAILTEMQAQIQPVWGEHFQITQGKQPMVYCMDKFQKNPNGDNLVCDTYIRTLQPIHIIEQFKTHTEECINAIDCHPNTDI